MSANRLNLPESTGRAIQLSRKEASTLMGFQRSAYAAPIKEILLKVLDDSRVANETETASEETVCVLQRLRTSWKPCSQVRWN